jgi:peptidoglycan-N-acetylglucosamine deacetylase
VSRALQSFCFAVSCAVSANVACSESPPTPEPKAPLGGGGGSVAAAGAAGSPGESGSAAGRGGVPAAAGSSSASGVSGAAGSAGNAGNAGAGGAPVGFQGGAVAAVSLTYDDGLDSHLAIAQPALEAAGFRGTFFVSSFEGVDHDWALPSVKVPLQPLSERHQAWLAAAQRGHELAGHTVNHPCDAAGKTPGFKLVDYDLSRMRDELEESLLRLARLGARAPFTFAYPCASDEKGLGAAGADYSALVAERFFAARGSDSGVAEPATVDLQRAPQWDGGGKSGAQLRKLVDDAIAAKGWLVLLFHGVGAEQPSCPGNLAYAPQTCMINYLTTSQAAHAELVQYLSDVKAQVWTAPFGEVAARIQSGR